MSITKQRNLKISGQIDPDKWRVTERSEVEVAVVREEEGRLTERSSLNFSLI